MNVLTVHWKKKSKNKKKNLNRETKLNTPKQSAHDYTQPVFE